MMLTKEEEDRRGFAGTTVISIVKKKSTEVGEKGEEKEESVSTME